MQKSPSHGNAVSNNDKNVKEAVSENFVVWHVRDVLTKNGRQKPFSAVTYCVSAAVSRYEDPSHLFSLLARSYFSASQASLQHPNDTHILLKNLFN